MKIITVTLNPCIDCDYKLSAPFKAGELNRVPAPTVTYSGKGINVSKALLKMGRASVTMGIFGSDGVAEKLRDMGLEVSAVYCAGSTRKNTAIIDSDGVQTQINEPGLEVSADKMREFIGLFKSELNCQGGVVAVLSGSVPPGVSKDIYKKLSLKFTEDVEYIDAEIRKLASVTVCYELQPEHITGKIVNEA